MYNKVNKSPKSANIHSFISYKTSGNLVHSLTYCNTAIFVGFLLDLYGLHYSIATFTAYLVSIYANFLLKNKFTFNLGPHALGKKLLKFISNAAVSLFTVQPYHYSLSNHYNPTRWSPCCTLSPSIPCAALASMNLYSSNKYANLSSSHRDLPLPSDTRSLLQLKFPS